MKNKNINCVVSEKIHKSLITLALKRSQAEQRMVSVAEVMRDGIEKYINEKGAK